MVNRTRFYPPDGGLKAQVRPVDQTLSAFKVIKDTFFKDSNVTKTGNGDESPHLSSVGGGPTDLQKETENG